MSFGPTTPRFTNYLRILDAKLTGATDDEIALKIYPQVGDQEAAGKGADTVRRNYKKARETRDARVKP